MRLLDTIEESVIDPNFENVHWDGWDGRFIYVHFSTYGSIVYSNGLLTVGISLLSCVLHVNVAGRRYSGYVLSYKNPLTDDIESR